MLRFSTGLFVGTTSHVAECPDIGPACRSATPPEPFNHHVDVVLADFNLDASFGLASWLALETRWTLGVASIDASFTELSGVPRNMPGDEIHHRDETLVGPRDPWLALRPAARIAHASGDYLLAARFGTTFPIGRTEPNPYVLGEQGIEHEHIQFGSGTFMPVIGGVVGYAREPVELALSAVGFYNLYANEQGFRAPSRQFLTLRGGVGLADGALTPYVEATLAHEGNEIWDRATGLEGDTERAELLVGGGLRWRFAETWNTDLTLRARVARFTDAPAFDSPGTLELGLGKSFELFADDKPER